MIQCASRFLVVPSLRHGTCSCIWTVWQLGGMSICATVRETRLDFGATSRYFQHYFLTQLPTKTKIESRYVTNADIWPTTIVDWCEAMKHPRRIVLTLMISQEQRALDSYRTDSNDERIFFMGIFRIVCSLWWWRNGAPKYKQLVWYLSYVAIQLIWNVLVADARAWNYERIPKIYVQWYAGRASRGVDARGSIAGYGVCTVWGTARKDYIYLEHPRLFPSDTLKLQSTDYNPNPKIP